LNGRNREPTGKTTLPVDAVVVMIVDGLFHTFCSPVDSLWFVVPRSQTEKRDGNSLNWL